MIEVSYLRELEKLKYFDLKQVILLGRLEKCPKLILREKLFTISYRDVARTIFCSAHLEFHRQALNLRRYPSKNIPHEVEFY